MAKAKKPAAVKKATGKKKPGKGSPQDPGTIGATKDGSAVQCAKDESKTE